MKMKMKMTIKMKMKMKMRLKMKIKMKMKMKMTLKMKMKMKMNMKMKTMMQMKMKVKIKMRMKTKTNTKTKMKVTSKMKTGRDGTGRDGTGRGRDGTDGTGRGRDGSRTGRGRDGTDGTGRSGCVLLAKVRLETEKEDFVDRSIDQSDLPFTFEVLEERFGATRTQLEAYLEAAAKITRQDVPANQKELNRVKGVFEALEIDVGNMLESMDHKSKNDTKSRRASYLAVHHQKKKIQDTLASGGFGKRHAKFLGIHMYEMSNKNYCFINPEKEAVAALLGDETRTGAKFVFVRGADSVGEAVASEIASWGNAMTEKLTALEEAMVVNEDWPRAMGVINGATNLELGSAIKHEAEGRGWEPWLVVARPNVPVSGAGGLPLPGMPQVLHVVKGDVVVHAFLVEGVLQKGIAIADVETFLETNEGQKYLTTSSCSVKMNKGDSLFLPAGAMASMVNYVPQEPKKDKKAAKTNVADHFAGVVSSPAVVKAKIDEVLQGPCKAAIKKWNVDYLKTKTNSAMWATRKEAFETFCKDWTA